MTIATVNHTAADMNRWTGRAEPFETERARYWYQLAQPYEQQYIGLVGFACDQGVRRNQGRVGARTAPPLIRQAFASLPVIKELQQRFDGQLPNLLGDAGDINCHDNDGFAASILEQAQVTYADKISHIIKQGGLPIGLGGGHAIAYGSFWDCGRRYHKPMLPMIQARLIQAQRRVLALSTLMRILIFASLMWQHLAHRFAKSPNTLLKMVNRFTTAALASVGFLIPLRSLIALSN